MAEMNGNFKFEETTFTKKNERFQTIVLILIVLVVILIAAILSLSIYLVVEDNKNEQQNQKCFQLQQQLQTTTQRQPLLLPSWPPPSNSPLGIFNTSSVAADNGICSEIGRNVLIHGGNAVDSSIAVLICIGVMDPHSSGLGGGHFMTIYNKTTKTCTAIDAREVAPGAATQDMYVNTTDGSQTGYLAIAVPGQLAGLWVAYKNFGGGVPWPSLLEPTIELCEKGYPVSVALSLAISEDWNYIVNEPTLNIFINNATGGPYQAGDIMTRPVFGSFLRKLATAQDPVQLFYNSSYTQQMVQEIQNGGGILTMSDMQNYQVKWGAKDRPIMVTVLKTSLSLCGPPPPSSAAVTGGILNILDGYNFAPQNLQTVNDNIDMYHDIIESMKFGYAARQLLGDMDFVPSALTVAYNLTTPDYGVYIRSKILPMAQPLAYYQQAYNITPGPFRFEDHGTSHMSVIDSQGNAVSATSTINLLFGCKRRSPTTGIIWNDEMDDFSTPNQTNYFNYAPTPDNYIVPYKRPLSSMSPMILYETDSGNVTMVTGAAGGSRIISATVQSIFRSLYLLQNMKEAIDNPRLHNQLQPLYTNYELGFPEEYIIGLITEHGQNMTIETDNAQATGIQILPNGTEFSNSDYRKQGGYPSGF